jgi:hypothetical protein
MRKNVAFWVVVNVVAITDMFVLLVCLGVFEVLRSTW